MPTPVFQDDCSVRSMKLLDYLDWVIASRRQALEPLTLPPVQRSALWRPRQILNLWRSLFDGMPIGAFYLSKPGEFRRILGQGGESMTASQLGTNGFDLLDGQQRTHALLLSVDPPQNTGRCLWVEASGDEVFLHLTTRAQPIGFDQNDERLGIGELRRAIMLLPPQESFDCIFDNALERRALPPLPLRIESPSHVWPLHEVLSAWPSSDAITPDQSREAFRARFGEGIYKAIRKVTEADIALIRVLPGEGSAGGDWLLKLFDRIGTGGTPLSGPERLYSMYKHHVPTVHDAVEKISKDSPGLLEAVEVARTAIRIAGTQKANPVFGDPAPHEFQKQIAEDGDLRPLLENLISPGRLPGITRLGKAFATVSRLLRYDDGRSKDEQWDVGLPVALVCDLHPELLRVLVHWALLSEEQYVDDARGDVIRFALFWYLCVTNDGKAAVQSGRVLHEWKADGNFPWSELLRRLTGADNPISDVEWTGDEIFEASDPSALRLASPDVLRGWGRHAPSPVLRSWRERFERTGDRNTAQLFQRWWNRSRMLLWLQRGYVNRVTPSYRPETARDDDLPIDLDHIQPQAAYNGDRRTQQKRIHSSANIQTAFCTERWTLGSSIGNFRWVPFDVNRSDGDGSICAKLRLDEDDWTAWTDRRPGAQDGAMDPASRDVWRMASAPSDGVWSEDRISAWQQAVEERTIWLYEVLWDDAGFNAWHSPLTTS
jgi:hypothetical protein